MLYKKPPARPYKPWVDDMINLNSVLTELDRRYRSRASEIHAGRNRRVYVMGTYVIKVPLNLNGVADNDWEGSVRNGAFVSEYELVYPKHKRMVYWRGIPVVFMEYVEPATSKQIIKQVGKVPNWVDRVDCGQVGFNKHGLLVAYDYGPR